MKKVWGGSGVWLLHIIYSRNGLPLADELTLFLQLRKRSSAVATDGQQVLKNSCGSPSQIRSEVYSGTQVGKQNHTAFLLKLDRFYMFFYTHQTPAEAKRPGGHLNDPLLQISIYDLVAAQILPLQCLFVCWSLFQSFLFYHSLESNLSYSYSLSYLIMFVTVRMSISLASS